MAEWQVMPQPSSEPIYIGFGLGVYNLGMELLHNSGKLNLSLDLIGFVPGPVGAIAGAMGIVVNNGPNFVSLSPVVPNVIFQPPAQQNSDFDVFVSSDPW